MKHYGVFVVTAIVAAFVSCASALGEAQQDEIMVEVVERDTRRHVPKARVLVISEEGGRLAEAMTDESGYARLPVLPESTQPSFVLVERQGLFVSGLRWVKGFKRYYIVTVVLEVK